MTAKSFEVWHGTPNEMAKVHAAKSQGAAIKWARDHLSDMVKQAGKFDLAAVDHIHSVREQMLQTGPIQSGHQRTWQFPFISVAYRIELRNKP